MSEQTFESIDGMATTLEAMVNEIDVAALTGSGATRLAQRLVTAERVLASCRTRALRRATEANQWRQAGDRSPAAWAAKVTGTSTGRAAIELETARQLEALPATAAAAAAGQISIGQAREVAGAATADPAAEAALLRHAASDDAAAFKRRCAQVRAAAETDEGAARERIHRDRHLRSWTDAAGAFCFAGRGLAEDGGTLLAAVKPYQDAAFHAARRRGDPGRTDTYAYDGLLDMARHDRATTGGVRHALPSTTLPSTTLLGGEDPANDRDADLSDGVRPGPRAKLIVRIDHAALIRGHTVSGETCQIEGIGPIPVATARELARDAFLTAVLTDGIEITSVVHLGRAATAHQRTALEARGMTCAVPGCGIARGLEVDHVDGWAITRRTHIDQLDWLCGHHHRQKTHGSYRLAGPPGNRSWHPPGDTGEPADTTPG